MGPTIWDREQETLAPVVAHMDSNGPPQRARSLHRHGKDQRDDDDFREAHPSLARISTMHPREQDRRQNRRWPESQSSRQRIEHVSAETVLLEESNHQKANRPQHGV